MEEARRYTLSIVVTALNEERLVGDFVRELLDVVPRIGMNWEIVLVDDGSTDNTAQIMDDLAAGDSRIAVVHNKTNLGLGRAYRIGVDHAKGTHVVLMCGDGGLPAENLNRLAPYVGKFDIVIPVVTNLKQIKTPARLFLSETYKMLLNAIFGINIAYYNGGGLHRTDLVRQVNLETSGFGFQAELLVKLIRSGATSVQVGVLGAEKSHKTAALRLRNFASVGRTLFRLLSAIARHRKITILPLETLEERA